MITTSRIVVLVGLTWGLMSVSSAFSQQTSRSSAPATPAELVATYDSLAAAILATKGTEENLVRSILSTSYAHANASLARARQAMKAGNQEQARKAIEDAAAYVAQLAAEGDNAVAGIRKRLVEGGHHHNASGESQGIYDPGFVVVTKDAKRKLLEASREIAQLSRAPNEEGLAAAWQKVEKVWAELAKKK